MIVIFRLGVQSRHLIDWIDVECFWFDFPAFADKFVGGESL